MDKNELRVERLKRVLNCKMDKELAALLQSHPPNITRWKREGFHPVTCNLIDALLDKLEGKSSSPKKLKK